MSSFSIRKSDSSSGVTKPAINRQGSTRVVTETPAKTRPAMIDCTDTEMNPLETALHYSLTSSRELEQDEIDQLLANGFDLANWELAINKTKSGVHEGKECLFINGEFACHLDNIQKRRTFPKKKLDQDEVYIMFGDGKKIAISELKRYAK